MTSPSTVAAMNCEAKLYAFRKSRDGTIISFVLHPQEVPAGINSADIGARFMLAMVELADEESKK